MIYEMRTYTLKPGTVPKAEEAFAERIAERIKLSPLGGFWRTEVGTLNQIIHVWPYKDTNERAKIRAEAIEKKIWPPKIADFVLDMESKILLGAPFSPNFAPGEHGGIYEFRTYTFATGMIPKVIERWSGHIKQRVALSPLIFAGFDRVNARPSIGDKFTIRIHRQIRIIVVFRIEVLGVQPFGLFRFGFQCFDSRTCIGGKFTFRVRGQVRVVGFCSVLVL